jgi:hypothetical protein
MNEQCALLQRAMDALNSICLKSPEIPASKAHDEPLAVISGSRAAERVPASDGISLHDPAEWREPFARWLDFACVRDPRCFGGVGCMQIAFCEWADAQGDVGCNRFTFECLLRESGFLIDEIAGVALVSGLTFWKDFEASGLSRE